jgi:hypothetical protein
MLKPIEVTAELSRAVAGAYSVLTTVSIIKRHCKQLGWEDVCETLKVGMPEGEKAMNSLREAFRLAEVHLNGSSDDPS